MSLIPSSMDSPVVVGIGEALFDCFPDYSLLGGAPVNLTVHAHQLLKHCGGQGVLVSRIGDDPLGRELLVELSTRGIPTNLVQCDPLHRTGQVEVLVDEKGHPSYQIVEDVAWDFLAYEDSLELLARNCSAVCFGTLAQRSLTSRHTMRRFLRAATHAIRMFDVNLRQSYFSEEVLTASLEAANVVKLNCEELFLVTDLLFPNHFNGSGADGRTQALFNSFQIDLIVLTRGSEGTVLYNRQEKIEAEPAHFCPEPDADSVGAGDACCAGVLYGLLRKWSLPRTLELANRMGAFVATKPGATPLLPIDILDFASAEQT